MEMALAGGGSAFIGDVVTGGCSPVVWGVPSVRGFSSTRTWCMPTTIRRLRCRRSSPNDSTLHPRSRTIADSHSRPGDDEVVTNDGVPCRARIRPDPARLQLHAG